MFSGCGADAQRQKEDAILSAQISLDNLQCQQAIDALEEVGRDSNDILYMKTLASAYACRASYNTASFFTDDIPLIVNSGSIIGSFTIFSNAPTNDAPDNDAFEDMQTAIDLLLYAGGLDTTKDPTLARRASVMKPEEAEEVNAFLLYMILDQMGRYFYHYGDASVVGVKGGRDSGKNECLANYRMTYVTTNEVVDLGIPPGTSIEDTLKTFGLLGLSGECGSGGDDDGDGLEDEGHPDFGIVNNLNVKRLCQGVTLWNNFKVILPEVIGNFTGDDLDNLNGISALLNTQLDYLVEALPLAETYVANTLSQTKCETDNNAYGRTEFLEWFFVFIFEPFFA